MLIHRKSKEMGHANHHWLDSFHHFSFANYYNPDNIQFGVLRVVNDDRVGSGTGFDMHHHENMEILSYVVEGELTHADSMGNRHTVKRGQVQYMSAGTGIFHSEHNYGHEILRFLQIWIFPDKDGYLPQYGDLALKWEDRIGKWLPIASGAGDSRFPIQIHADIHIYSSLIPKGEELSFAVPKGRQAYLINIEGVTQVGDLVLQERDALEIYEEDVLLESKGTSHLFVIEMAKS